jgi:hypothetical protein
LERFEITSRKSDIEIDEVALVWLPWRVDPQGSAAPVYSAPTREPVSEASVVPKAAQRAEMTSDEPLARG